MTIDQGILAQLAAAAYRNASDFNRIVAPAGCNQIATHSASGPAVLRFMWPVQGAGGVGVPAGFEGHGRLGARSACVAIDGRPGLEKAE